MKNKAVKYKLFNSKLTSIISISMVLFLLGIVAMVLFVGKELSFYVKENFTVSVMLHKTASDEAIHETLKEIETKSFVKKVRYISKEDAMKELAAEMGEDPMEFISYNPLQPMYEINLKSEYADNDSILFIAKELESLPIIEKVDYQKKLISDVTYNIKKISVLFLSIAVLLLIISFVLINNTVRLNVYARRFTIHTMKLVGATRSFIRAPFLVQAVFQGVFAAFIAIIALVVMMYFMRSEFEQLFEIFRLDLLLSVMGIVLVAGIVICLASTWRVVNKLVSLKKDELYY
jgi:cell division transport system permease protein